MIADKNEQGSKRTAKPNRFFKQITRGDLVTIRDKAGDRTGHAARREYGNWVLVLERNMGTALATKENTVAVSKPKRLGRLPKVGQRLVYDDGRRRTGEVVQVGPGSMYVLFNSSMEPTLIHFDDPEWVDYITFDE